MAKFFVVLVGFAIIAQVSMTFIPHRSCGCGSEIHLGSPKGLLNYGSLIGEDAVFEKKVNLHSGSPKGLLNYGSLIGEDVVFEKKVNLQPIHGIERVSCPICQYPVQRKVSYWPSTYMSTGYWPINSKACSCGEQHRGYHHSPPAPSC